MPPSASIKSEEEEDSSSLRCSKCSRKARKGCTQALCLKCCADSECLVHKEQREQALFREQVLEGTTDVQLRLKNKRSKQILKGRFREPGFAYMGDTVVIWSLREYLANPKWRDEALRKSSKRRARDNHAVVKRVRNSRKQFRLIIDHLYQKSLKADGC